MGDDVTSRWHVAGAVALYWFVSISLVFINKKILTDQSMPLFITWSQCMVTLAICWICGMLGERIRREKDHKEHWLQGGTGAGGIGVGETIASKLASFLVAFPKAEYKRVTAMKVMPLSAIFVVMIITNQLTLLYVEVSFYNVARAPSIIFNALFSVLLLKSRVSFPTICSLAVVIIGFVVGIEGEAKLSLMGVEYGLVASIAVSLNSIYTKKALAHVKNDAWLLTFNNNANAWFLFLPLVYLFESATLMEKFHLLCTPMFLASLVVSGTLGFLMGIVTVMQVTSPLTHNIPGTAKSGCQSAAAFIIWRNKPTFMTCLGIFLVILGTSCYTAVKIWEARELKAPVPVQAPQSVPLLPK